MVKLLCGLKGTGKTKRLIEMANSEIKECKGDIVFIEASNKHIFDLNHNIRLINAMDFDIKSIETLHGFLCGIISENYDIEKIYISRFYNIVDFDIKLLPEFVKRLEKTGNKFDVDIVLSMRYDPEDVPEEYKSYIIEL